MKVDLSINPRNPSLWLVIGVVLIGAALFAIRVIAIDFRPGTRTPQHPYILFTAILMIAGLIWAFLIPILKSQDKREQLPSGLLWGLLWLSLIYRTFFFGSVSIYEDDWKRYLWDGYMVTQAESPFEYSPNQILADQTDSALAELRQVSEDNGRFLHKINNPHLSTIYPPAAQGAFGLAALMKPFDLDALRLVFLLSEALTLFLLIKALPQFGRSRDWVLLYAFCPLLIFSGFNVAHMDILLPPFLVGALLAIGSFPKLAGVSLAGAAAVKMWPLILAPALYRHWRKQPLIYVSAALLIAILSLIALSPMISALGETSGLQVYAQKWQRSSFIFPYVEKMMGWLSLDPERSARLLVAMLVAGVALFAGFGPGKSSHNEIPGRLLLVTLALLFLSPTGFPWYVVWALPFLPFLPLYSVAVLCALVPLYYVRFALGEQGVYDIYLYRLVPLQFGLPLLILAAEFYMRRRET